MLNKNETLENYRKILNHYGSNIDKLSPRDKGRFSNKKHNELKESIYEQLKKENASLEDYLMNYYCYVVSMLESRQKCLPYNDIEFSRRIGEVWEGMCQLILTNPLSSIKKLPPESTNTFYVSLKKKIEDLTSNNKKNEALLFYNFLVELLGNINLALDFNGITSNEELIGIDFKSGFGSNEKGNTQRILQVGRIYKYLNEKIELSIVVRQDENNNYYNTIRQSKIWNAIKGNESYEYLAEISGCNSSNFLKNEVNFSEDIQSETFNSIGSSVSNRDKYISESCNSLRV